jgi:hypothetical protein
MDIAYVSALSALAGSVVGGLTSTRMTWLTQRSQVRSGQLAHEFARREDLFRDFIVAASETYGDALVTPLDAESNGLLRVGTPIGSCAITLFRN